MPIFSRLVGFDLVNLLEPEEALFGKRHQDLFLDNG